MEDVSLTECEALNMLRPNEEGIHILVHSFPVITRPVVGEAVQMLHDSRISRPQAPSFTIY